MRYSEEKRQAFLNDPSDRRHGTNRGYQLKCRCDRCLEAGRAYGRASMERAQERKLARYREERERERRQIAKAKAKSRSKARKDVCTVPEFLKPLMGKPSLSNSEGRCFWCGAYGATNHHHIVFRSAGTWVKDGIKIPSPTVLLCGEGNASGCHGKAHQKLLHFRWVELGKGNKEPLRWYGGGHWEAREFEEPLDIQSAWQVEEGWRRL